MSAARLNTPARLFLISALLALSVGACAYRHEKGASTDPGLAPKSPGRSTDLSSPSFAEVRTQVLAPSCTSCHHHREDYVDYAGTFAARDEIFNRVYVLKDMPKRNALTPEQSVLLKRWLDAGAPQEARQEPNPSATAVPPSDESTLPTTPIVVAEPGAPSWAKVQAEFFTPHCTRCHNSVQLKGELDLTSWEQTRERAALNFERVMIDRDMPKNKAAYDRITKESKRLFVEWIDAGMPGPESGSVAQEPAPEPSTSPAAMPTAEPSVAPSPSPQPSISPSAN